MSNTPKIDYMGLRKIFENNGNQKELMRLIIHYLKITLKVKELEDIPECPLLKGVTIDPAVISSLCAVNIITLIINDAEPQSNLIDIIVKDAPSSRLAIRGFFLYKHHKITAETFLETLNGPSQSLLDILYKIIIEDGPKSYPDIDMTDLRDIFCTKVHTSDLDLKWLEKYFQIALYFLKALPYDQCQRHLTSSIIRETTRLEQKHVISPTAEEFIKEFVRDVTLGIRGNELVECFYERRDWLTLFSTPILSLSREDLLAESKEEYTAIIDEIFDMICRGRVDRIGFALTIFPELRERKFEILNTWIENEMALELDYYGNDIIEGNKYPNDEKYIIDKYGNSPKEPENGRQPVITPTDKKQKIEFTT